MKNILILFIFLSFSCTEKKEVKSQQTNTVLTEEPNKNLNSNSNLNLDTIQISALPFGNKMLIDNFKKIGLDYYVTEKEEEMLITSGSVFLKPYENIIKLNTVPFFQFYKFPQKNKVDFGLNYPAILDSIRTYQGYYALAARLPNVGENKILIFNSLDNNESFEIKGNWLVNNIDLVVVNKDNKIINSLNLSRRLLYDDDKYENYLDRFSKYFYIDKDYTIHIKYFTSWGDARAGVFAYNKYKIQEDGAIVQYFDQANGFYKTEAEEGNIKNHLKEGIWKEMMIYPEKEYYEKNYKAGKIEGNIKLYMRDDVNSVNTIDSKSYEIIDYNFKVE